MKTRTSIIADDIEAELAQDPQPLLVLCGGEEQKQVLKAELSKRGIHAESYGEEPADMKDGPGGSRGKDISLSGFLPSPSGSPWLFL